MTPPVLIAVVATLGVVVIVMAVVLLAAMRTVVAQVAAAHHTLVLGAGEGGSDAVRGTDAVLGVGKLCNGLVQLLLSGLGLFQLFRNFHPGDVHRWSGSEFSEIAREPRFSQETMTTEFPQVSGNFQDIYSYHAFCELSLKILILHRHPETAVGIVWHWNHSNETVKILDCVVCNRVAVDAS